MEARSWSESVEAALLAERASGLKGVTPPGNPPCRGSLGAGLGEMVVLLLLTLLLLGSVAATGTPALTGQYYDRSAAAAAIADVTCCCHRASGNDSLHSESNVKCRL